MAVEPDEQQVAAVTARAGGDSDGPVVMLNLHRYRDRDAYLRYGEVAAAVLERVGGRILWYTQSDLTVIGDEDFDEVIAVWYPSLEAFTELAFDPEVTRARSDRAAGLEQARLICCYPGTLSSELQR
jgi:uncharacterized protein (DUF1330 family)